MLSKIEKKKLINALNEDIKPKDITTDLLKEKKCTAEIIAKENCVLAGSEEAIFLFKFKKLKVKALKKDGMKIKKNQVILVIHGSNKKILETERTALNFLSRMSGIATAAFKAKLMAKKTRIALTRKTAPLLNLFDKKAGKIAGIYPHRLNLSSAILIKDNHLAFDSITNLVNKAKKKKYKKIEVECSNFKEIKEAINAKVDVIMLDNFSVKNAKKAIKYIRIKSKALIELSGGINFNNLQDYAKLNPDIISMGLLTHSSKSINFSLEIRR